MQNNYLDGVRQFVIAAIVTAAGAAVVMLVVRALYDLARVTLGT